MKRLAICIIVVTCMALRAGPAVGADQLVLGDTFVLLNSDLLNQRAATASALERNATATIVGDPTQTGSAGGAILTLIADGGTPSSQTFSLPQGTRSDGTPFWTAVGTRVFAYSDPAGEQGPVRLVVITKSDRSRFTIQAAAVGNATTLDVVPPNPGTDAFMTLQLGLAPDTGDRYCVQYGPESKIVNIGDALFAASNPKAKGCPPTGPTTTTTTVPTTTTTSTSTTTTAAPTTTTSTTSTTTAAPTTTTSTTVPTTTTTATTPSTTTTTTTTAGLCGNGVLDPGEQCDGSNFGSFTCPSPGGALLCTSDCKIDFSQCPSASTTSTTGASSTSVPTTTTTPATTSTTATIPATTTSTTETIPPTTIPSTTTPTTSTTSTTSTTTTTLGSPSGAFLDDTKDAVE